MIRYSVLLLLHVVVVFLLYISLSLFFALCGNEILMNLRPLKSLALQLSPVGVISAARRRGLVTEPAKRGQMIELRI